MFTFTKKPFSTMLCHWIIACYLSALIGLNVASKVDVLESNNECEFVSLLGTFSSVASICSDGLAVTHTKTSIVTVTDSLTMKTATVTFGVTDTTTALDSITATVHDTSTSLTTTKIFETILSTTVEVVTVTSSTSTTVLTEPPVSKKRRGITIEHNTFDVDETVNVIILDLITPTSEETFVLAIQTPIPSNILFAPSAGNVIYTTAAP